MVRRTLTALLLFALAEMNDCIQEQQPCHAPAAALTLHVLDIKGHSAQGAIDRHDLGLRPGLHLP